VGRCKRGGAKGTTPESCTENSNRASFLSDKKGRNQSVHWMKRGGGWGGGGGWHRIGGLSGKRGEDQKNSVDDKKTKKKQVLRISTGGGPYEMRKRITPNHYNAYDPAEKEKGGKNPCRNAEGIGTACGSRISAVSRAGTSKEGGEELNQRKGGKDAETISYDRKKKKKQERKKNPANTPHEKGTRRVSKPRPAGRQGDKGGRLCGGMGEGRRNAAGSQVQRGRHSSHGKEGRELDGVCLRIREGVVPPRYEGQGKNKCRPEKKPLSAKGRNPGSDARQLLGGVSLPDQGCS